MENKLIIAKTMKSEDKDSIKMEHGAGGEGMRELLKLVLRYFNFNLRRKRYQ